MKQITFPKNDDPQTNAIFKALQDMSNGKSIFEAFLGKDSEIKKYITSVSLKGSEKIKNEL